MCQDLSREKGRDKYRDGKLEDAVFRFGITRQQRWGRAWFRINRHPRFDAGMKAKLDFLVSEYQPITREGYARHACISEFECHHPHFVLFNLFSNPPSLSLARATEWFAFSGKKKRDTSYETRHIAALSILQVRWEISRCRDKSFLASIVGALDRATFS